MTVGWVPYRDAARIRVPAAATPDALEVACTDAGQSAMAAARLQLRRMVEARADAVRLTPRLGRGPT
jgi:hypothetical protein